MVPRVSPITGVDCTEFFFFTAKLSFRIITLKKGKIVGFSNAVIYQTVDVKYYDGEQDGSMENRKMKDRKQTDGVMTACKESRV